VPEEARQVEGRRRADVDVAHDVREPLQQLAADPGTDVIILKIFSPKNLAFFIQKQS
jgi:hypothetical protein